MLLYLQPLGRADVMSFTEEGKEGSDGIPSQLTALTLLTDQDGAHQLAPAAVV